MNTLVPKYSDGSFDSRPFIRDDIFLTFLAPPKLVSPFISRSPTHQEPASTTAYFRPGNFSNFPL